MIETKYKIYMDVCCFNRPFDDLTQERIRLEAEAIAMIITRCQMGEWELISSEAVDSEIEQTPDIAKIEQVMSYVAVAKTYIQIDTAIKQRTSDLLRLGFKPYDALHLVCAEVGNADVLLTTDDRLLRKASKHRQVLRLQVENPVTWLMATLQSEGDSNYESN